MKKTILTIVGSALIIFSAVQLASANEQNHRTVRHRTSAEFRNSNAFVAPAYEAAPESYRYSGGYSAPAGH
ncbi:MAG TPA: hypothetical protein VFL62_24975, partial [Bradyrhizobium sp.]|uniref:hypothetical protein n=1 Tax=Bradyrhizobium sp. TaxID=376 RepID=UPI002D7E7469